MQSMALQTCSPSGPVLWTCREHVQQFPSLSNSPHSSLMSSNDCSACPLSSQTRPRNVRCLRVTSLRKRKRKQQIELSPPNVRQRNRGKARESRRDVSNRNEAAQLLSAAQGEVRMAADVANGREADTVLQEAQDSGEL